jgi:hypothetical protein
VHITEFFAGTTSANIALYVSMSGFFLANKELRMIGKIIDKLGLIMTDLDEVCGGVHEEQPGCSI